MALQPLFIRGWKQLSAYSSIDALRLNKKRTLFPLVRECYGKKKNIYQCQIVQQIIND